MKLMDIVATLQAVGPIFWNAIKSGQLFHSQYELKPRRSRWISVSGRSTSLGSSLSVCPSRFLQRRDHVSVHRSNGHGKRRHATRSQNRIFLGFQLDLERRKEHDRDVIR